MVQWVHTIRGWGLLSDTKDTNRKCKAAAAANHMSKTLIMNVFKVEKDVFDAIHFAMLFLYVIKEKMMGCCLFLQWGFF